MSHDQRLMIVAAKTASPPTEDQNSGGSIGSLWVGPTLRLVGSR